MGNFGFYGFSEPAYPITPQIFNVPLIVDPTIWLKPETLSLNNGDAVATWPDSSGNAYDFVQTTAAQRPTFNTSVIKGQPAVRFGAATPTSMTYSSLALTQFSIFIVTEALSWPNNYPNLIQQDNTNTGLLVVSDQATRKLIFRNVLGNDVLSTAVFPLTSFQVVEVVQDATTMYFYLNGTLQTSPLAHAAVAATKVLRIGQGEAGGNQWNGFIPEVLIYNTAVTTAQRQSIEAYLFSKYF